MPEQNAIPSSLDPLNPTQRKIVSYLAQGLAASQVASIVGVSKGYMSQLIADDGPAEFKRALQEAQSLQAQKDNEEDEVVSSKYLAVEHRILDRIQESLPYAELPQLISALKVVGDRQEKRAARMQVGKMAKAGLLGGPTTVVQLVLPGHCLDNRPPVYQVNSQNEVIEVNGRGMAPLGAAGVKNLFRAMAIEQQGEEPTATLGEHHEQGTESNAGPAENAGSRAAASGSGCTGFEELRSQQA